MLRFQHTARISLVCFYFYDVCMTSNPLVDKSYDFSLQIIHLCRNIVDKHRDFVLSKQLLRSATSIGANIQEANGAQGRKDFVSKMNISLKEANESLYWLRLLRDANLIQKEKSEACIQQCSEIKYMLISSIKTAKSASGK